MADIQSILIEASIGLVGAVGAWFVADIRNKVRSVYLEEKVKTQGSQYEAKIRDLSAQIDALSLFRERSTLDRQELHNSIERLESSKASKDVMDGTRMDINTLRTDMDKRFDRIERLLDGRKT